jgi:hypothetical protein
LNEFVFLKLVKTIKFRISFKEVVRDVLSLRSIVQACGRSLVADGESEKCARVSKGRGQAEF